MKTIATTIILSLSSCAGWNISSPYGEINSDKEGIIYVPIPKPIIIKSNK